jgi:hypothetical protein
LSAAVSSRLVAFDHLRERLFDLLLGVIDVLDDMQEKVIHRVDIAGEQTHGAHSRKRWLRF